MATKKGGSLNRRKDEVKIKYDIFQLWAKNANQQMLNILRDEIDGNITTDEKRYKLQRAKKAQEFLKNKGYKKTRKNQLTFNFPTGKDKLTADELRQVHEFLGIKKEYDNPFKEEADIARMNTFLRNNPGWTEKYYWAMRSIGDREGFKKLKRLQGSDEVIDLMNIINSEDYEEFIRINIKKSSGRTAEEQEFLDKLFESTEIVDDVDKIKKDLKKRAKEQKLIPLLPY